MNSKDICNGCKACLSTKDKIICSNSLCGQQYHFLCVNLTAANYKKQRNWECPDCALITLKTQRKGNNTPVQPSRHPNSSFNDGDSFVTLRPSSQKVDLSDYMLRSEIAEIIRTEIRSAISTEFTLVREQLSNFETSLQYFSDEYDKITTTLKTITDENTLMRNENISLQNKMKDLESRLAHMEQDARQNNLEINCLPEHKNENLIKTIVQIGNAVSFPIAESEIISCTRVQKSNPASKKPKAVVCKLSSKAQRDNLLGAILIYNRKNPKNKLNTKLIGYGDTESPVYVSEHLTPANKSLHAATRIAAKEKNYKYVWVRNGRIFIRKDETAISQIITHRDTLKSLT